jgi:hypothetical protein
VGDPSSLLGGSDCFDGGFDGAVEWSARFVGTGELLLGDGDRLLELGAFRFGLRQRVGCVAPHGCGGVAEISEPLRDRAPLLRCRLPVVLRELAALGGGGDVGVVGGEDHLEDVKGVVEVVAVGDD